MSQSISPSMLYERDLYLWVVDTVAKLKSRNFAELDLEHLVEEIENLAGRDRREVESRLDVLLNHWLKRCYIPTPENYRGWELTIREQRKQLQRLLKQSPSLQNYLQEVFEETWNIALTEAREDYPKVVFPDQWPFSCDVESILSQESWQA